MKEKSEFHLGWKVLIAGILGIAFGASPLPYNAVGFTVEPLQAEFGWSVTEIILPITIYGVTAALLAPLFGLLADRYGVRPVAMLSLLAFAITFGALGFTPASLGAYYFLWFLVGLVCVGSTPLTFSRAISMWFFKHRGLALGILLLGTSASTLIVPRVAVWAIESYGWRDMYKILAVFPLVAFVVGLFLFREPIANERPKGIVSSTGKLTGVTLQTALRDRRFWLIFIAIIVIATLGGAFINIPKLLSDKGFEPEDAASVMGVMGLGIFTGRLITGVLLDKFWAGYVGFPLMCLPAITSMIFLGDDFSLWLAMLAGYLLGFSAGAESDLIAYLAGRYFGMANYGKIFGMLYLPFALFSAISPLLYSVVRDLTGSYDAILLATIPGFILGGSILLFLGKYPELDAEPD